MSPTCSGCGKFMKLADALDLLRDDACEQWMYWVCSDDWDCPDQAEPIPAPQYQWEWNCQGIPQEDLDAWPELKAECEEMWNKLPKSRKRLYKRGRSYD